MGEVFANCRRDYPEIAQGLRTMSSEEKDEIIGWYDRADESSKRLISVMVCEVILVGKYLDAIRQLMRCYQKLMKFFQRKSQASEVDTRAAQQRIWEEMFGLSKKKKPETYH